MSQENVAILQRNLEAAAIEGMAVRVDAYLNRREAVEAAGLSE